VSDEPTGRGSDRQASVGRIRENDPFRALLGPEWQKYHWFATAEERDRALEEMSRKHEYSRVGDRPALVFVKVEKLAESRSL